MNGFEDEAFGVKEWINDACRQKPIDTPLETYIAQLELQLQLRCEEVEGEIETTASQLAQQIPNVLQKAEAIEVGIRHGSPEAELLKGEMTTLHETLEETVTSLNERATQARGVVSGIKELHKVKANMQSACDSLKEATELSELFVRVDAVFSSGDIFAMAKIMSTMRRSLKLVGNVPEFQSGKDKLKVLEESLVSSVEAKLFAAILEKQEDQVKKLSEILVSLERQSALEKIYVSVKKQEMKGLHRSTAALLKEGSSTEVERRVKESVTLWHEGAFNSFREDVEWCTKLFPNYAISLPMASLIALLYAWNPCLEAVLERQESVELAIAVQQATLDFVTNLEAAVGGAVEEALFIAAFQPTEKEVERLSVLQREILMQAIDSEATPLTPSQLDATLENLFRLTEAAIDACLRFTGGVEMPALAREIEGCWLQYVTQRTGSLKGIRNETLSEGSGEPKDVSLVLHLLKMGTSLEKHVSQIQSRITNAISQIQSSLKTESPPRSLVHLRLKRAPERHRALTGFLERGSWFGEAAVKQAVQGFSAAAEALVFDVLMHKPRFLFKGFSSMEEWRTADATPSAAAPLPQFSAYPQMYVTAFGEFLMVVPQQLEALVSTESEIDDQILEQEEEMASGLLTKVIVGCAELYADEILGLTALSSSGVAQLTCDLQYFANVLSAMGAGFPQPLSTVYEALTATPEKLQQRIDAPSTATNTRFICEAVLKMRQT